MELTQGDEVVSGGDLAPDVPEGGYVDEHTNTYQRGFYESTDLPVRQGPADQSGEFYTNCRDYDEFQTKAETSEHDAIDLYEAALPGDHNTGGIEETKDACWVGYLDKQYEYATAVTALGNPTSDPIYFLNPAADDDDCQHGDWAIAQVEGSEDQIEDCSGDGHKAWHPGSWHSATIDVDLIESAFAGDDGANCQEATCGGGVDLAETAEGDGADARDYHGSGTISLPLEYTATTFLFGYAHPNNPAAENYDVGPNDAAFSQPLWGVPDNACGDRIPDDKCQLLGPQDLKEYDTFDDNLDEGERGRLCSFNPDTTIANPQGLAGGPCGIFGSEVTTFIEETTAGGFGTGTVQTYQSTFPGWKNPLLTLTHTGHVSLANGVLLATGSDYDNKGSASAFYDRSITAVNPKVPSGEDQAWCMRPQIMTDGTTVPSGPHEGASAPGVYGDYQAAAIDVDMHPATANVIGAGIVNDGNGVPGYEGFEETLETLDPVLDPAGEVAGVVLNETFNTTDEVFSTANDVLNETTEQIPEETPVDEAVNDGINTTNEALDTAFNASDRVGPTEDSDAEPKNQVGDENWDSFVDPIPEGIACENGVPVFSDGTNSLEGALQFDNTVSRQTTTLKDPTILDDANLPAREDNTTDGTWQTDSYSFGGPLRAFVDSSGDEAFSGCAPSDGEPHPDQDNCVWSALWDAYNPSCTGSDDETNCDDLLAEDGYVPHAENRSDTNNDPYGVGLVSTLEVSGTTLLYTTDTSAGPVQMLNEWTVVNQDPAQSTCVIMTSEDFQDSLATHVGDDTGKLNDGFGQDERDALCPDHSDDQTVVWDDAFSGQGGPDAQGFSASVNWAKLSPTPDAVRESMEMADDRLCLTGVFSTSEDVLAANTATGEDPGVDGTTSNIQLGADSTTTYYTDCDVLTSHVDEDGEPDDGHPLDGRTTSFPDYSEPDEA